MPPMLPPPISAIFLRARTLGNVWGMLEKLGGEWERRNKRNGRRGRKGSPESSGGVEGSRGEGDLVRSEGEGGGRGVGENLRNTT